MEHGVQSVMNFGKMKMLVLYVNSLGFLQMVSIDIYIEKIYCRTLEFVELYVLSASVHKI